MNKEETLKIIESQTAFLESEYHVKNIGVFGSVARGDDTEKSDVDILVEFNSPIGFFQFIRLENHLSKILEKKVDLISKKAIKPAVKKEILKEVIYV